MKADILQTYSNNFFIIIISALWKWVSKTIRTNSLTLQHVSMKITAIYSHFYNAVHLSLFCCYYVFRPNSPIGK